MYFEVDTWLPHIACQNTYCAIKPKTAYKPIRKTGKCCPLNIKYKLSILFQNWNKENDYEAYEGVELDVEAMAQKGRQEEEKRKKVQ